MIFLDFHSKPRLHNELATRINPLNVCFSIFSFLITYQGPKDLQTIALSLLDNIWINGTNAKWRNHNIVRRTYRFCIKTVVSLSLKLSNSSFHLELYYSAKYVCILEYSGEQCKLLALLKYWQSEVMIQYCNCAATTENSIIYDMKAKVILYILSLQAFFIDLILSLRKAKVSLLSGNSAVMFPVLHGIFSVVYIQRR